jgi:hypothetical protein
MAQLHSALDDGALPPRAYPYRIRFTVRPAVLGTAGYVRGTHADHSVARHQSTAGYQGQVIRIGQQHGNDGYTVNRGFLAFDTSTIPDDASLHAVHLSLTPLADHSDTDFMVMVKHWEWLDALRGRRRQENFFGCLMGVGLGDLVWQTTSEIATREPADSVGLDPEWITRGPEARTRYCLQSFRDVGGFVPTGDEYIDLSPAADLVIRYRP